VSEFFAYVAHELGIEEKDADVILSSIERSHLYNALQKAVEESDMPTAVETLYEAIGEAVKAGKAVVERLGTVDRLVEKNKELTSRLQAMSGEFSIDVVKVQDLLAHVDAAVKPKEKGESLENLASFVLDAIPGWKVVGRNKRSRSSELDLIVENSNPGHPFLKDVGPAVIVECKNWEDPVGAPEIRDFGRDIQKRRIKFGILVSRSGITGDPKSRTAATNECWDFYREGVSILVLDRDDFIRVIQGMSLVLILREKARELMLMG